MVLQPHSSVESLGHATTWRATARGEEQYGYTSGLLGDAEHPSVAPLTMGLPAMGLGRGRQPVGIRRVSRTMGGKIKTQPIKKAYKPQLRMSDAVILHAANCWCLGECHGKGEGMLGHPASRRDGKGVSHGSVPKMRGGPAGPEFERP